MAKGLPFNMPFFPPCLWVWPEQAHTNQPLSGGGSGHVPSSARHRRRVVPTEKARCTGSEGCISEALFLQTRSHPPGASVRPHPFLLSQEPGSWLGSV